MHILNSLQLAVEFHKTFAHLQGYQDPKNVIDTAKMFMTYLQPVEAPVTTKPYRNPSKSDNS